MKLSGINYHRHVSTESNPENLQVIKTVIDDLNKTDVIALFPSLSIGEDRIYFLRDKTPTLLNSRIVLKTGYQSLLGRLGIPFRVVDNTPSWIEIPLVNGKITWMAQCSAQQNVTIRMINNEIRAVLSNSYTAIDDKEIINLMERLFLPQIREIQFTCSSSDSNTRILTREQFEAECNGYTTSMFLYISNSEIGDASVRCGIGMTIQNTDRTLSFQFVRDTRTLGRVIHRGEAIKRLEKEVTNLFAKTSDNWNLIQNALRTMSNVTVDQIPTLEQKMIKTLESMPEFKVWKTQYDEIRKTTVVHNMFDLIYVMSSIPYKDESFNNVVEEIVFGRFF
ncbi:MAG TPA: hypothetical protein VI911_10520 [Patescibacteria group bacterium]|nr:hypothetical protein [Patescibacteria group bacterium]